MFQEDRARHVAAALDGILEPGDEYLVRRIGDQIEVVRAEDKGAGSLAATYPELYGRLLQLNQELDSAGNGLIGILLVGVIGLCVATHMQWLDRWLQIDLQSLRSFWVYGAALVGALLLGGYLAIVKQWYLYRRRRYPLLECIHSAGFFRRTLLARIEKDKSLKEVAGQLRADRRDDPFEEVY